ncbi:T6SS immunity protein Tli4 family protein [Pantoea anthophila]|uniref:T6SS immunity protein Tli4 family protein n=1 Tax=Pantoea anthophila TaxID=470931 RepID=UPI0006149DB4|nr:T6SS immunity protein Tli4 family protein [Pantoea anthophila]
MGLLVVILILSTVFWLLTRSWPVAPLTAKEKQMTDKLFEQTRPQCIGRYLFDVPASFSNVAMGQVKINEMRITSKRLYPPAFAQRIRLREQELNNSPTVDLKDLPYLKQVYRINDNAVIFDRNENGSVPGFGRVLEGHLYSNGVAFIVTTEITDLSDLKYKKDREDYLNSGSKESDLNDKPQKLAEMQSLLSRLKGREDEEVPVQPGICIPEGFISDTNMISRDDITYIYKPADFEIIVNIYNTLNKGKTLLERGNEINAALIRVGANTLKKGTVKLPDIDAEEWLMKGKQDIYQPKEKTVNYYTFQFYGNEKTGDLTHPVLSVELHNSGKETKTYTDSQLVDIWDRITRTFRYRTGSAAGNIRQ